jgi:hypothetical protein
MPNCKKLPEGFIGLLIPLVIFCRNLVGETRSKQQQFFRMAAICMQLSTVAQYSISLKNNLYSFSTIHCTAVPLINFGDYPHCSHSSAISTAAVCFEVSLGMRIPPTLHLGDCQNPCWESPFTDLSHSVDLKRR